jgi:hypothetical protein
MAKSKVKKVKQLWKGCFNWQYTMAVIYRAAYSREQARELMFRVLADRHNVSISAIREYFSGEKDNYNITVETEYKEDEQD